MEQERDEILVIIGGKEKTLEKKKKTRNTRIEFNVEINEIC